MAAAKKSAKKSAKKTAKKTAKKSAPKKKARRAKKAAAKPARKGPKYKTTKSELDKNWRPIALLKHRKSMYEERAKKLGAVIAKRAK
jgi:RNA polymerase primary sigma factor